MPERLEGERGGNSPRAYRQSGEGAREPVPRRTRARRAPLRPLSCGRGWMPGPPPLSCGGGSSRADSDPRGPARRGAPTLSPVRSPLDGGDDARTQRLCGAKRPACPALSRAGCRPTQGRSARPLSCGRAPRSGRLRSVTASNRQKVAGEHNAAAPLRRLSCRRARRRFSFGRSPIEVPLSRRYPAAAAPVRGSRPLLRPLSCGRGGGDRVCGLF